MRTPSEIGKQIADEIEKKGHWRSNSAPLPSAPGNSVCVLIARSFPMSSEESDPFIAALSEKIGVIEAEEEGALLTGSSLARWNDTTPTDEVLAVLRSL